MTLGEDRVLSYDPRCEWDNERGMVDVDVNVDVDRRTWMWSVNREREAWAVNVERGRGMWNPAARGAPV